MYLLVEIQFVIQFHASLETTMEISSVSSVRDNDNDEDLPDTNKMAFNFDFIFFLFN